MITDCIPFSIDFLKLKAFFAKILPIDRKK